MQVVELWRWPVDGADGESTPSVRVDLHGVVIGAGASANLRLDADPPAWAPGAGVCFPGGVRLRVLAPLAAGGARARVVANGRVAAGERVELVDG
jgi:hypothetical protein